MGHISKLTPRLRWEKRGDEKVLQQASECNDGSCMWVEWNDVETVEQIKHEECNDQ